MRSALHLPDFLQQRLSLAVGNLLNGQSGDQVDFSAPRGAAALTPPNSISWRIFKNPVALFIGGTAAVLLELAEPQVRAGVWEHSSFRTNPLARLKRTGLAAMITVYGARHLAESMIRRITHLHSAVRGVTTHGVRYAADDPRLLTWVHATATYGFAAAYGRYVAHLSGAEIDRLYREACVAAGLYGADSPPQTRADMQALFEANRARLSASSVVFEFLEIMSKTPALPPALRWMQRIMVRAAVELLPAWVRERLGLGPAYRLRRPERWLLEFVCSTADRLILPASPAVQACMRLGLPAGYLYLDYPPESAYFAVQSDD